jgi:hypothetical protein
VLVPVGLHHRISNGCWRQLKGSGDCHGHAMACEREPPPPIPNTHAQLGLVGSRAPFQSEGNRGSQLLLDIPHVMPPGGIFATLPP